MRSPKKTPRLADIAKRSGESAATVSRVLNGLPHVRPGKRKRVLDAARDLGYQAPSGRRPPVVILVEGLDAIAFNTYQSLVLAALTRSLVAQGLRFEIAPAGAVEALSTLPFEGALGLVYSAPSLAALKHWKGPLLLINSHLPGRSSVCSDHRQSTRLAVARLVESGHRRIAFLHTGTPHWGNQERLRGYLEMLREKKLSAPANYRGAYDEANDFSKLKKIIGGKATALIVSAEENGVRAHRALHQLGLSVPRDISLVSFEFPAVSAHLVPATSTICQEYDALAARAVAELMAQISGPKTTPTLTLLPTHWQERESVAPPTR